jgi:hypothetical protein
MKAKFDALRVLQVLMWGVCAFHAIIGLGLNLGSSGFIDAVARFYGADVKTLSPDFLYILRPLGAFMLALGIIAALAALEPVRYRGVIYAFAVLFVLRAFHRVLLGEEAEQLFGISAARNAFQMVFFFALAAALVALDWWHTTHPATRSIKAAPRPTAVA